MDSNRPVRVRFAPSPTGPLHIGGVRTALFNYLFARHHQGTFILRIEDTDQPRTVPGAENYIIESLNWCGIHFDEGPHIGGADAPYRQSERMHIYSQYAKMLVEKGYAYYAFDTSDELEEMRKKLEAAGRKNPAYDQYTRNSMKNSLVLPSDEVEKRLSENQEYVIRFKVPRNKEIRFKDIIRGRVVVNSASLDDKVLLKSDGMPTYHLANIVDDKLMNISHVIRGEEWLPSTPLHILLYEAFGWEMPEFAHLPLILKPDGNGKLSKRDGDQLGFPVFPINWEHPITHETANGFKEAGYLPEALINFLAFLGWNPGTNEEILSMDELIKKFSLERVGSAGVKFYIQKAQWYNGVYLRKQPVEKLVSALKPQIIAAGLEMPSDDYLAGFIELMQDRINFLPDFITHGKYFFIEPDSYDVEMANKKWTAEAKAVINQLIPVWENQADWHAAALESSFKQVCENQKIAAGKVLPAIRLALTGGGFGPGVFDIAALIGSHKTIERLKKAITTLQPINI